jgi:hypothetical protein
MNNSANTNEDNDKGDGDNDEYNDDDSHTDESNSFEDEYEDSIKSDENDSFSMQTFLNYVSQYIQQQNHSCNLQQPSGTSNPVNTKHRLFICILCKIIFKNTNEYLSHLSSDHNCILTKNQEDYMTNENDADEFKAIFVIKTSFKIKLIRNFDFKLDKILQKLDYDNADQESDAASNQNDRNGVRLLFIDDFKELNEFISKIKKIYEQESKNHDANKNVSCFFKAEILSKINLGKKKKPT